MKNIIGFILFALAVILLLPLTIINFFLVEVKKGYFFSTALNLDIWSNREFRTLWNKCLRLDNGYKFGKEDETISSALGKNERDKTLTKTGKILVWLLDKLEKNHCKKSIKED